MVVENQSKFFINIFIFACFRIFHQTHDSTFFWMSPKFLACDTSWSRESIFRNITFPIPIEYRFCGRNHFFCQSFSKFHYFQWFIQNTSPFCCFKPNPNFCLALIVFLAAACPIVVVCKEQRQDFLPFFYPLYVYIF